ncbi:MAG: peptidoglycan DD-metalloendopeptidase family protein [Chloroflexia bacterium]
MFKRVLAWGAILLLPVLALALHADNARGSALSSAAYPPRDTGSSQFLTLPFNDPNIVVQQGWVGNSDYLHAGLDYILGPRDSGNWRSFDVVAAAEGWACGNCTTRQGNAVWVRHQVDGKTYYTYYGHLAAIEPNIPIGNQQNVVWVQRGQKLGDAGMTGADAIHVHFQVNYGPTIVDPYDLWQKRDAYSPGCSACSMGPSYLWTTNPPSLPDGEVPSTPPLAAPSPTPRPPAPTATPTPASDRLAFEQTVAGTISEDAPEAVYHLRATAGDWAAISMFATGGSDLDTFLKLYTPDGKILAVDDDGAQVDSNSFLVQKLPQTGLYEIVATHFGGSGDYKLRVEKGSKSALGDLNRDCVVNQADISRMSTAMGGSDLSADLNLDGTVDAQDQQIQAYRLGRGCMQIKR